MTQQHPITPPPKLVQQWLTEFFGDGEPIAPGELTMEIASRAAQWGYKQHKKCCLTPCTPLCPSFTNPKISSHSHFYV
jgi:hypothetical protein